jgi:hypothetical protein
MALAIITGKLDLEKVKRKLAGQHGILLDKIKHVLCCSNMTATRRRSQH